MANLFKQFLYNVWAGLSTPITSNYDGLLPPAHTNYGDPQWVVKKQINQINIGSRDCSLRAELLDNINSLKSLNPGWTYRMWTDEDVRKYIVEHYGEIVLKYFDRINPDYGAARADLFRYLLIYNEGGVYLDLKSTITKPIEMHLKDEHKFVLAYWDKPKDWDREYPYPRRNSPDVPCEMLINWGIVAAPRHPALRDLLLQCFRNIDGYNYFGQYNRSQWGVFLLTGPKVYMDVLLTHYEKGIGIVGFDYLLEDWGFVYSIYGDDRSHLSLYQRSYRDQVSPIVWNVGPLMRGLVKGALSFRSLLSR